jgi:two-component system, cell cycle sensor histidine kinase and response regulator CckA
MKPAALPLRIVHLEDSVPDAVLIHALIEQEWPGSIITRVDNRADFLSLIGRERIDLILSDFTLPAFNGLDALALAHKRDKSVPFIIISGTIGEDNAVLALQRGAVDYVIKDRPARLIPAIQRALALRHEQQLRQEAESRLREQAELLDKARDAIFVTDLEGCITYRNRAASQFLESTGPCAGERLLHELFRHAQPGRLDEAVLQLHLTGSWKGEVRMTGTDGNLHHIESRWTLVQDDAGRPKSILLINTDVTEQKHLEAQLLRTQRLEGIGTLAGGVAHDLNNALSPILMAVSLLRVSVQDENLQRLVSVLENSAQHGSSLIRQLLAFARGTEGERTDLAPQLILKDVVALLSDTLPRTISIETNIARDLRLVRANSTQLVQVLMNLAINARDAMPKGGRLIFGAENVVLEESIVRSNPGARPGPHVRISVSDTGTGIAPELLSRIFDPFFTTKAAGKGTGLGLSMVASIIKGHGGIIQVHSEVGEGTAFTLYLPALPATSQVESTTRVTAPARGHGEMILVIDDDEGVREIARTVLVAHGFTAAVAADGQEGLLHYMKHRDLVKVVVTDMMMPGIQGREVIAELLHLNPDICVVAMSGIAAELAALPKQPARLALLTKPMTAHQLINAVQSVMPVKTAPGGQA